MSPKDICECNAWVINLVLRNNQRSLLLAKLLPTIVEAPYDQLAVGDSTELLGFALELGVEELQTSRTLDSLDCSQYS